MIVSPEWQQVTDAFTTFLGALDKVRDQVKQKQKAFEANCTALQKKIETAKKRSNGTGDQEIVRLNVGGQAFHTSKETLMSVHESFFWCMLHSSSWSPDDRGEYFVDRSPIVFPLLLEFMRSNEKASTQHLSEFENNILEKDLEFYGLKEAFAKAAQQQSPKTTAHTCSTQQPTPTSTAPTLQPPKRSSLAGFGLLRGGGGRRGGLGPRFTPVLRSASAGSAGNNNNAGC